MIFHLNRQVSHTSIVVLLFFFTHMMLYLHTRYGWFNCGFVPAWQSIYGGMTLNIGLGIAWPGFKTINFSNPNSVNNTDMVSWRSAIAHQLVYGSVLSWQLAPQFLYIMQHSPQHLQFVQDAIALRKSAKEYLIHGRVMRPPVLLSAPLPTVTWFTSAVVPHTYNACECHPACYLACCGHYRLLIVLRRFEIYTHSGHIT
eukprot:COSAG05_NODE_517_length_9060_cov_7.019306_5_plen_200_part_00